VRRPGAAFSARGARKIPETAALRAVTKRRQAAALQGDAELFMYVEREVK